jgi:3-keto-disaccharide hydrolase
MRIFAIGLSAMALLIPVVVQGETSPFVGRWDFNISTPAGTRACWLGVTEEAGKLDVWFQPTGGNVYQVNDFKVNGSHLTLNLSPATATSPAMMWELDAKGGKLTGVQKHGNGSIALTGVRAPVLKRRAPKAWTSPQSLFNGKNLDGWEPIGNPAHSHWKVKDGVLLNEARGANLRSTRKFNDFKLHFEVNCPEDGNSGFYLRGRYEVQIEYEPLSSNPPERRIGSIYGRIAPDPALPRTPGKWETFDVTLVGRTVTEVHNGVTVIDHKEIEGITGGALDANEAEPGPFYIQGDHTGGLQFRNITVSVPER